ncbi:methylenetetrahydrofolate reduct [Nadsonia fulvescens var. elongata DSM 6958]|uniref:Methylenetetrahydrofolate reduct n=1 Tax=Nadsonia fulvescens var. elongata DSM 6958 TaxID=857566 RepID=A0A1E3PJM3_9ASCO|nr:methylenetetrahydrofolate reduct [Nadsonia fulvescens var. elongata DSM 6958]
MRISKKLEQAHAKEDKPTFSFEFFVPKTSQGVQNLYDRMDRMYGLGPQFIDVTWNAGGRLSNLTTEIVDTSQSIIGLDTCMHLTCTGMPKKLVEDALRDAYNSGCQNILALRGDPPTDTEKWQATEGGFSYAKDLVKYIRAEYGDYFDIGVAAYPEGTDEEPDVDLLIEHLKEKCDAGADFIITQMFYNVDKFLAWVTKCRAAGITIPIIPGIMPISTHASFLRRANWCKINIPQNFHDALEPVKNDDMAVRELGTKLVADMCQKMLDSGEIKHLHFYTMNLEKATIMVLEDLKIIQPNTSANPPLPWRQSLALGRQDETVRPIFWKNRKQSYINRTQDWDEFPNGRWGDSRSPAYGELENYGRFLRYSSGQSQDLWGEPTSIKDIGNLFAKYVSGDVKSLPWSDSPISNEVELIKPQLIDLNSRGFLTINSQPAINGVKSSDPVHGWGPKNGYVYQKAYLELLVSPKVLATIVERIGVDGNLTYYSVNKDGELSFNVNDNSPNAVTWGIYPGKEVIQPTIVEKISFLAWKDEAFGLGEEWASCYPSSSKSRELIDSIVNSWHLINIVNNDFHDQLGIFDIFEGLTAVEN